MLTRRNTGVKKRQRGQTTDQSLPHHDNKQLRKMKHVPDGKHRGRSTTNSCNPLDQDNNNDETAGLLKSQETSGSHQVLNLSTSTANAEGFSSKEEAPAVTLTSNQWQDELTALQQELDIAEYGVTESGQLRRKLPREQMLLRSRKLKILQQQDELELADPSPILPNKNKKQENELVSVSFTTRGGHDYHSMQPGGRNALSVSFQQNHDSTSLNESSHHHESSNQSPPDDDGSDSSDQEDPTDENPKYLVGINDDNPNQGDAVDENIDEDELELDEVDEEDMHDDVEPDNQVEPTARTGSNRQSLRKRRRSRRMKNFRSYSMARRHGEALGAFAQGMTEEAIQKLKQVARDAPSAPQVYFSLGMVYEDMLNRKDNTHSTDLGGSVINKDDLSSTGENARAASTLQSPHSFDRDSTLTERIAIATKAYGSYHVAAILCKRDYKLWLRAADCASEIANLHTSFMLYPSISATELNRHRAEKERWLGEARNDYRAADHLKPPGIDVPAKLASVLMDLGQVSEALTLLTDLIDRPEFEPSYRGWLLYANLMLHLGYECSQWNSGVKSNKNNVIRRWLRKHADTFQWQEGRLRALSNGLVAAAGSESCFGLIQWLAQRVPSVDTSLSVHGLHSETQMPERLLDPASPDENKDPAYLNNLQEPRTDDRKGTSNDDSIRTAPVVRCIGTGTLFPLSASYTTICTLARELIRQMIELELYEGGKRVGESVAHYSKARARLVDQRNAKQRIFEERQARFGRTTALQGEAHDEVEIDSESDAAFSDEDEFTAVSTPHFTESMRRGILPPELRVLYGICLAGMGNMDFAALKCMEGIHDIPLDTVAWLTSGPVDAKAIPDDALLCFHSKWTEPFGHTDCLSMIANAIVRSAKKKHLAGKLTPMFTDYANTQKDCGFTEAALSPNTQSLLMQHRKGKVINVLLSAAQLQIEQSILEQSNDDVLKILDRLLVYLPSLWRVEEDGSLSTVGIDLMENMSRCLQFLANNLNPAYLEQVTEKIDAAITFMFQLPSVATPEDVDLSTLTASLPFLDEWLTEKLKVLSARIFSLLVAMNCSHASGWGQNELFVGANLTLDAFVGISSDDDGLVSGLIGSSNEDDVSAQWLLVSSILPIANVLDFTTLLTNRRSTEIYKEKTTHLQSAQSTQQISSFGEDRGFSCLLAFSRMSLLVAKMSSNSKLQSKLVGSSLAILLPAMQFCLSQRLWSSTIGCCGLPAWSLASHAEVSSVKLSRPSDSMKPRRTVHSESALLVRRRPPVARSETFDDYAAPLNNFLSIPLSLLKAEWSNGAEAHDSSDENSAILAMQAVELCTRRLRGCYSEQAVEKSSLQLALALVSLATCPSCENPFLCLQHAAMYASQGSKLGSNDKVFQHPLPIPEVCTSLEALGIIGRADCLQAIYFFPEASFLCRYVARICGLRRFSSNQERMKWNSQWKVVSILAYNLSVTIRYMSKHVIQEHVRKEETIDAWDDFVEDELSRAKADGLAWMASSLAPCTNDEPLSVQMFYPSQQGELRELQVVEEMDDVDGWSTGGNFEAV